MNEPNERDAIKLCNKAIASLDRATAIAKEMYGAVSAPAPAQSQPCDGCGNSYGGHYVDTPGSPCVDCHDGSNRREAPAQSRDEEALILKVLDHFTLCDDPHWRLDATMARDAFAALRARLASSPAPSNKGTPDGPTD